VRCTRLHGDEFYLYYSAAWLVTYLCTLMIWVILLVQELRRSGTEITDELEDEYYMSRLDAGLFTLQLVDYIMLDVCHTGPSSVCCHPCHILFVFQHALAAYIQFVICVMKNNFVIMLGEWCGCLCVFLLVEIFSCVLQYL